MGWHTEQSVSPEFTLTTGTNVLSVHNSWEEAKNEAERLLEFEDFANIKIHVLQGIAERRTVITTAMSKLEHR